MHGPRRHGPCHRPPHTPLRAHGPRRHAPCPTAPPPHQPDPRPPTPLSRGLPPLPLLPGISATPRPPLRGDRAVSSWGQTARARSAFAFPSPSPPPHPGARSAPLAPLAHSLASLARQTLRARFARAPLLFSPSPNHGGTRVITLPLKTFLTTLCATAPLDSRVLARDGPVRAAAVEGGACPPFVLPPRKKSDTTARRGEMLRLRRSLSRYCSPGKASGCAPP